ncbi:2'-5' RNA ligase family protein [Kutzneria chonburiensis]|uniref:2'-5' RNA ligase family protein n=1 Tax=Kutzneria chonburiensis TaxID=1483604 RepID=UPI00236065F5|nr:2'-5' RNA ligase family protein [Kutzneria chonburiensis]
MLILAHSSDNTAMTLPVGVTGVIIPVLAVEPLLDRPGVPPRAVEAHVTVLYPWVPMDLLTDEDGLALAAIFAETAPIDVRLAEFRRFPTVLYLRPEPEEPFRVLTRRIAARWPAHQPYGGEFGDDVQPHLTVTTDVSDEVEEFVKNELLQNSPCMNG